MDSYSQKLKKHLEGSARQSDFACMIDVTQAAVSRYIRGLRFPDAETARKIDAATGGAVPFKDWQDEAMKRFGIAA